MHRWAAEKAQRLVRQREEQLAQLEAAVRRDGIGIDAWHWCNRMVGGDRKYYPPRTPAVDCGKVSEDVERPLSSQGLSEFEALYK